MELFDQFLNTVRETVNPATQPVAVSIVRDGAVAEGKKIRVRGQRLAICQQIAYSRMYGWSTWTDQASAHCVLGAACAGLIAPPARVLDGSVNTGIYQKDQAAAAAMQQAMPRLPAGTAGVLTTPLARPVEGIAPDLVVIYLNAAQAMRFVQAFLYREGGTFVMKSSGDAGVCSRAVAQVYLSGEPAVEIPCLGDRRFAMTQDHELCVGIPLGWLERTMEGLAATHKAGIRYPVPFQIPAGCDLPPAYITAGDDC
ncbi:DUF169 domain-containing protein [Trichlorobacter ammonificans]|uniref:DUF169 domain-containing protein n=1 Tax=Trichlorobacter ammonificans TaxID=2916410 RepID=A0ABM9D496_9BACT|nr:DUF169 domain-containing protein [Trichlorobacter ammonificans]CAH2030028.1 conserved protein of unknown function [Trichlorobacter ammonificans]